MKYLMMAALAAIAGLAVACGGDDDNTTRTSVTATQTTSVTATSTPTAAPTASAASTPTANPLATVCQTNPNPAPAAQTVVNLPLAGAQVTSPVTVSGEILAFEAQFNIAIKDASGVDIATVPDVFSSQGQTLAPFSTTVPFTVTTLTPACLWVFDISEADGTPIQVVQVPIMLAP